MQRILANATVEALEDGECQLWEVQVTGLPPFEHRRTYTLEAKTDNNGCRIK